VATWPSSPPWRRVDTVRLHAGFARAADDAARAGVAPGSRVLVVPDHCCAAVNLVDDLWPTDADEPWPVVARGRNG
jgi:D-serine deaminase-like pyridoxal phosphate-dependent protein